MLPLRVREPLETRVERRAVEIQRAVGRGILRAAGSGVAARAARGGTAARARLAAATTRRGVAAGIAFARVRRASRAARRSGHA